jgi:hypothetical protein
MDWGGDWTRFKDQPHLEMPPSAFFKSSLEKDQGFVWQTYLTMAGTYSGVLDGIFGTNSLKALKEATGEDTRNLAAWDKLFTKFGKLDSQFL